MQLYSLNMTLLALLLWGTSSLGVYFGSDFPNCVAGAYNHLWFEVGFVSNHGVSTSFITANDYVDASFWLERRDGYCCMWMPPPTPSEQKQGGFGFVANSRVIGWDCPYWLMVIIWAGVFLRNFKSRQIRLKDLLLVTSCVAVACALINLRMVLPIAVALNLSSALLILLFFFLAGRALSSLKTEVIDKSSESTAQYSKKSD